MMFFVVKNIYINLEADEINTTAIKTKNALVLFSKSKMLVEFNASKKLLVFSMK